MLGCIIIQIQMTKKTKAENGDFGRLSQEQIDFIQAKVVRLGSVENVKRYYNRGDLVGEFARLVAVMVFG
jgi:hypothetical protein